MKVLITGTSGFLGSWFLDHFIREGDHEVWGVDLVPHPAGLPMDAMDMEEWLRDFDEDVDLALHFAAPVGGRMKIEFDPMYNADAFRLDSVFFRWAVKHARVALYPSSSAVYPTSLQGRDRPLLLNEGFISPQNPNWSAPDELYGFSKLAGEYMAWKAADKHGLNVLCVRPFSGYGPGQTLDYPVPSILSRALRREDPLTIWGSQQTRDFVYVTDVVGATMARLAAGVDGYEVMNIASGSGLTFEAIARIAARHVGYDPEIRMDPTKPTGVMHRRGDPARMQFHYQLAVPIWDGIGYTLDALRRTPESLPPLTITDVRIEA